MSIKVLIVDDSAVVRQILQQQLSGRSDIEVIGAVSDPVFAMNFMQKQWPDVLLLDIEMPRMDGITFLKKLMKERPLPVVICSTLTARGSETAIQAMAAGAVSIITKPGIGLKDFLVNASDNLVQAIKGAARVRVGNLSTGTLAPLPIPRMVSAEPVMLGCTTDRVVAIGTSTGGTQALERIFTALPRTAPGILVVQHMPEKFTAMFAERLNSISEITVREAHNHDRVLAGQALIAPGGRHLRLVRNGAQYRVEVLDGPMVNRHKPSVDVLFHSVARVAGRNAAGFILTGMGDDGARGLKAMRDAGAITYAQDEASCIVYGMPKEAVALGAAGSSLSLDQVPAAIMAFG